MKKETVFWGGLGIVVLGGLMAFGGTEKEPEIQKPVVLYMSHGTPTPEAIDLNDLVPVSLDIQLTETVVFEYDGDN